MIDFEHGRSAILLRKRESACAFSYDKKLTFPRVSTGNGQPSITIYNSTLNFDVDDENDMRILPPTLFVRLRQEKAADRINDILHTTHKGRSDDEAIVYLNLQAERLRTERKAVDGVDTGMEDLFIIGTFD